MIKFVLVNKIVSKLICWRLVAKQRKELDRMSDELLKDIGLSRSEATREANRHFWDTCPVERKCE